MAKVTEIKGVGPATAKLFAKSGFNTVGKIADAAVVDLATIPGVGEKRASSIIGAAGALLGDEPTSRSGNGLDREVGPVKKLKKKKNKKDKDKKSKKAQNKKKKNKDKKNKKKGKGK